MSTVGICQLFSPKWEKKIQKEVLKHVVQATNTWWKYNKSSREVAACSHGFLFMWSDFQNMWLSSREEYYYISTTTTNTAAAAISIYSVQSMAEVVYKSWSYFVL